MAYIQLKDGRWVSYHSVLDENRQSGRKNSEYSDNTVTKINIKRPLKESGLSTWLNLVGAKGFEPMTPTVSR